MMGQPDLGGSWGTELAPGQTQDQAITPEELITEGEGVSTITVSSGLQAGSQRTGDFIAIKSTIPPIPEEETLEEDQVDSNTHTESVSEQVELKDIDKQGELKNGSAFGATSHEPSETTFGGVSSSAVFLTRDGTAVPNGNLPIMPSDQTDMAPEMTASSAEDTENPSNGNLPLTTETFLPTESITSDEDKSSKFKRKKVSWNEKVYVNRVSGEGPEDVIVEGLQEEDHEYSPFEDDEVFPPNSPQKPKTIANGTAPKIRSDLERREKIQTYVNDNNIWVRKCCICVLAVLLLIVILALIALAAIFVWRFVPQHWSSETENIRKRLELSEVSNMTFNPFTHAWSSTPDDRVRYFLIEEEANMTWRKPNKPALITWLSGEPLQVTGWNPNAVSPYNDFLAGDPIKVAHSVHHVYLDTDRWYTVKIAQEQKYSLLSILPLDEGDSVTWTRLIENPSN